MWKWFTSYNLSKTFFTPCKSPFSTYFRITLFLNASQHFHSSNTTRDNVDKLENTSMYGGAGFGNRSVSNRKDMTFVNVLDASGRVIGDASSVEVWDTKKNNFEKYPVISKWILTNWLLLYAKPKKLNWNDPPIKRMKYWIARSYTLRYAFFIESNL